MSFQDDFRDMMDMAKVILTPDMEDGKPASDGTRTLTLKCPYCGTENKVTWKKGVLPRCPNCGGEYEISEAEREELQEKTAEKTQQPSSAGGLFPKSASFPGSAAKPMIIVICMTVVLFAAGLIAAWYQGFFSENDTTAETYEAIHYGDLYVPEIGRECAWDEDGEWWYDQGSDSYFRYQYPGAPATWIYWFPEISRDFGDYGWMYYDETFDEWYIEVAEDEWEEVPEKYDTFSLWYLHDDLSEMDLVTE